MYFEVELERQENEKSNSLGDDKFYFVRAQLFTSFLLSLFRPYSWILWTLCSLSIKGKARAEFAQEILFCVDYSYVDCAISCHVN